MCARAARDFKFRDQIRDAASSAARNVFEGFARFRPKPFAQFMEYSIASTMETRDLILDCIQRKYFTTGNTSRLRTLVRRSLQVSRALLRYLKGCKGDGRGEAASRSFSSVSSIRGEQNES
jgi:four helix bundle protein